VETIYVKKEEKKGKKEKKNNPNLWEKLSSSKEL